MVLRRPSLLPVLVPAHLSEQGRRQTPVTRFAAVHSGASSTHYRDLIPLTAPGPAEQYAFEVSLDSCSDYRANGVACHSLTGLEENESRRAVGRPCVRISYLNRRSLPAGSSFPSQSEQASDYRTHRQ